jgi:ankyrin repeat protein
MKYIKLFESFEEYDPYELMIIPPNKKAEMLIQEIKKKDKANLNLVNDLIVLGANLDWQDTAGWTALHFCASRNHPEIARMLIDAGADLNIQDTDDDWTALHWCAIHNHPEIAKMLIDAGADLNIQDTDGSTALHYCADQNHPELLRMLISAGADKTIPTNDGKLPYELAKTQEMKNILMP